MRETIIRFDDALTTTVADFSVQEQYVDIVVQVAGSLVLPSVEDPIVFQYRGDRRLNWVGDDQGGGWNHTPLNTYQGGGFEFTQIYTDATESVVLPEHWAEALEAMTFAPKLDYAAITRELVATLRAHVDPALVFMGALKGSLPTT